MLFKAETSHQSDKNVGSGCNKNLLVCYKGIIIVAILASPWHHDIVRFHCETCVYILFKFCQHSKLEQTSSQLANLKHSETQINDNDRNP